MLGLPMRSVGERLPVPLGGQDQLVPKVKSRGASS